MAITKGGPISASEYNIHTAGKDYVRVVRKSVGGGVGFDNSVSTGNFWVRSDGSTNNMKATVDGDGAGSNGHVTVWKVNFDSGGNEVLQEVFDLQSSNSNSSEVKLVPGYYAFDVRATRLFVAFGGAASASLDVKPWQNTVKGPEIKSYNIYNANSTTNVAPTYTADVMIESTLSTIGEKTICKITATRDNGDVRVMDLVGDNLEVNKSMFLPAGTYSIDIDIQSDAGTPTSYLQVKAVEYSKVRKWRSDFEDYEEVGPGVDGGLSHQDAENGLFGDGTYPGGKKGETNI